MKKLLILGDSISIGYREIVKQALEGRAEVVFPDENGRFAAYTEYYLERGWADMIGKPDIIHWNNGLWDTHMPEPDYEPFTPVGEYITHLERTLKILRRHTDNIIFATTTAVTDHINQTNAVVKEFNAAAVEFMSGRSVKINDLYALVSSCAGDYLMPDKVHLTPEGYDACAKAVLAAVEEFL